MSMKPKRQRELLVPKSIGFPPELYRRAMARARRDQRSLSSYVRKLIVDDLAAAAADERRAS